MVLSLKMKKRLKVESTGELSMTKIESASRDAGLNWTNQMQFTSLSNDGQTILTMVVNEVADAVKNIIFGPHLSKKITLQQYKLSSKICQ